MKRIRMIWSRMLGIGILKHWKDQLMPVSEKLYMKKMKNEILWDK